MLFQKVNDSVDNPSSSLFANSALAFIQSLSVIVTKAIFLSPFSDL